MNKGGQIEEPTEFYRCLLKCVYGTHKEYGERENYLLWEAWLWNQLYSTQRFAYSGRGESQGTIYPCVALCFPSAYKALGELLDFRRTIQMSIIDFLGEHCWKNVWHFNFNFLCFPNNTLDFLRPFSVLRDVSPVILSVFGVI